ncbi:MAG: metalloregulator ArsR/SmtB family transcription factor [Gammaproteobacteria bacterium]|nr:metalloregulator ArsR/SmtB family transcription factor [Gammaproteobacteria bacterium]
MASDTLSQTFNALADPTRRAILANLTHGPRTVAELATPFAISAPAISKHLKVLERAGLIARGRKAQTRPCGLQVKPLAEAFAYLDDYRRLWDQSLDRLDAYLQALKAQEQNDATG